MLLIGLKGLHSRSELVPVMQQCSCVGFQLTYECTVTGEIGATVWRGSIFQCPSTNDAITLRHSAFTQMRSCNKGAIIGHGVKSQNRCYTSQINISVNASMNNKTVECVYNNGSTTSVIGTSVVIVISDPLPPPEDVEFTSINGTQVTFRWSPVAIWCPSISYSIDATGCGVCENVTYLPSVDCTKIQILGQICNFAVRVNACNGLVGNKSNQVSILLQIPDAPLVDLIPIYLQSDSLSTIMTTFHEVEEFNISDGLSGSPDFYHILYSDSVTNSKCGLEVIPAHACINNTCNHFFDVSSTCPNSNAISVTVTGFNILGEGRLSNPVIVPVTNQLFVATFDIIHSRVVCTFLADGQQLKSCSLTYGEQASCNDYSQTSWSTTNTVTVGLPALMQSSGVLYCYTLTANNGTHTVITKGTFVTDFKSQSCLSGVFIGVTVTLNALIILVIITANVFVMVKREVNKEPENLHNSQIIYEDIQTVNHHLDVTIDTERNESYISASDGL